MAASPNKTTKLSPLVAEQHLDEQRLHDVLLLLQSLVVREELIIKPILDYLYDVASHNLINNKCNSLTVNKTLKLIAKMPKSAFKIVAWHWFKKNFPQLIVNWLQEQVTFNNEAKIIPEIVVDSQTEKSKSLALSTKSPSQEVKYLRYQVRVLIGILVTAITAFSGGLFWMNYELKQSHLEAIQKLETQIEAQQKTANHNN
ncbi:MAG: hypothetical protein AAF915_26890 [Cyanobacteria bacterium P01_D01_bin.50]